MKYFVNYFVEVLVLVTTLLLEGRGGFVVVHAQEATSTIADQWRIDPNVDIDYYNYVFKYTYT
jgi:hypothetical protein